jgi:acetate kinase
VAVLNGIARILIVNAGSSSLKLRVLDERNDIVHSKDLPAPGGETDAATMANAIASFGAVDAVGHRIVHGGTEFTTSVVINSDVIDRLRSLIDLAPLHQPKSLAALDAVSRELPDVPRVACFDTAFHSRMPEEATTYALPPEWRRRWTLKRYGFHGLSHAYASRRAAEMLGRRVDGFRVVTCHLGAGASLAAVHGGRSVDTTMGFTPLEGLIMATRSGSVDPGLLLWLEEHAGTPPQELAATLEYRSGMLGLAGTGDMREIEARHAAGDKQAELALAVYVHRLRAGMAAMAAAMEGLDAVAFTGGVGENSSRVRDLACHGLSFLGIEVDRDLNDGAGDRRISDKHSRVPVLVIAAREDLEMAREVRAALGMHD